MYRARDRLDNEEWLTEIQRGAATLDLGNDARTTAEDLFLSDAPAETRSKRVVAAASLYAGALIAGEERSQTAVADAMEVSRLSIQKRWKPILREAGFRPPSW